MSEYNVTFAPGFYLPANQAWTAPVEPEITPLEELVPTEPAAEPPSGEIPCPRCPRAPLLSKERDTSPRDGRLTCYICGWKAE